MVALDALRPCRSTVARPCSVLGRLKWTPSIGQLFPADKWNLLHYSEPRLRGAEEDTAKGRHKDDEQRPPGGRGKSYKRGFGVPDEKAQSNFTDQDSRIMKTADGYQQCYNGQLAVDGDFKLIVANALTANASDQGGMLGLLDQVATTLEALPESLLADAGYRKEDDLKAFESRKIDAYVSIGREGKQAGEIDAERYPCHRADAAKACDRC